MPRSLAFALTILMIAIGATFATADAAVRNPLIRTCNISGGIFEVYPNGSDDIPLCVFGALRISAQTLVNSEAGVYDVAAQVILADQTGSVCADVSGRAHTLPTGDTLCIFADGSKLTLNSVIALPSSNDRLRLKEALAKR